MARATASLPHAERLVFRTWQPDDFALAWGLWGDPEVVRHIDARGRLDRAGVRERLDQECALAVEHGVQYWPIFWRASGEHVGCAGLRPRPDEAGVYELGFHIRSSWWGRGLATEAARAVVRHAFETLGARALFAGHGPDNHPSRQVLRKLGFVHTHDELYPPTGAMHPSYRLEPPAADAAAGPAEA